MATITGPSLLPEVETFLRMSPLKSVVGGKDVAGSAGETMQTLDPGTGEPLAEFCVLSAADVDRAVQAATQAFKTSGWATMPPNERGVHLHRLAQLTNQRTAASEQCVAGRHLEFRRVFLHGSRPHRAGLGRREKD